MSGMHHVDVTFLKTQYGEAHVVDVVAVQTGANNRQCMLT
jgi:hypothetical protein